MFSPFPLLLKWPGGKRRELNRLMSGKVGRDMLPNNIKNCYEPFVGGGAFYLSVDADQYFINDKAYELMCFYRMIKDENEKFFNYISKIQLHWEFISEKVGQKLELFHEYFSDRNIKKITILIKRMARIISRDFDSRSFDRYMETIVKIVVKKIKRIIIVEDRNSTLSDDDFGKNIEGAFKAAFYTFIRDSYNIKKAKSSGECDPIHIALFYFLRENCYSSMFRYNSSGEFNVPYGGLSYNPKDVTFRFKDWRDENLIDRLRRTVMGNVDFYDFLIEHSPQKDDFVFIDPPYDTKFSTYAENSFGAKDHKRLADYLIYKCRANWLQIIKNTDFIYSLYANAEKDGIVKIISFDKTYSVSFRNRNDRHVEHLAIMNYK